MTSSLKIESLVMLVGFISVCFLAAAMGAIFRPGRGMSNCKTVLAAAQLGFCTSLDAYLPHHCCFRVAGVARGGPVRRCPTISNLSDPIVAQRCLDAALLRPASTRPRLPRHCSAVVIDHRHHDGFPSPKPSCRFAAVALSCLGHLCGCAQF